MTNGFVFLALKPRAERERSQQEIVQRPLSAADFDSRRAGIRHQPAEPRGAVRSNPVEYVLQADSYDDLNQAVGIMMGEASKLGYLINLDTDLRLNKPQLDITIDRERAAGLGVSVTDIGSTLETLLGGTGRDQFQAGNQAVRRHPADEAGPTAPRPTRSTTSTSRGAESARAARQRRGRPRNGRAEGAEPLQPHPVGDDHGEPRPGDKPRPGAGRPRQASPGDKLPAGIKREYGGQSLEFKSSSSSLYFMFLLAIVFIYLVLAAQFESFVHPLTILLSVPLAVFGALLTLFLFGQSLNIYSQIGLIMLIGLVTKNAILIVEFSNQLRARGKSSSTRSSRRRSSGSGRS